MPAVAPEPRGVLPISGGRVAKDACARRRSLYMNLDVITSFLVAEGVEWVYADPTYEDVYGLEVGPWRRAGASV
jgi:hypothetical protein